MASFRSRISWESRQKVGIPADADQARIERDKALERVVVSLMKDDTELFKQFMDNESFRRWLTDTVFNLTYDQPHEAR
jgi:type I restriction enzyme R subunit